LKDRFEALIPFDSSSVLAVAFNISPTAAETHSGRHPLRPSLIKNEDIDIQGYKSVPELPRGLKEYRAFYPEERLHQSVGYATPGAVYRGSRATRA
jgi:hypothetical protein